MITWVSIKPRLLTLVSTLVLCVQLVAGNASFAQSKDDDVEVLTNKIVQLEIDLERYSLNYRLSSTHESNIKALRYFAGQQASSALQMTNGIVTTSELSGRKVPNRNSLKQGVRCVIIGTTIGASSSAFELATNCYRSISEKCRKQDASTAKKHVFSKLRELNDLFAQAGEACKVTTCPDRDLHLAELRLLRFGRDSCLNEFAAWYADSHSQRIGENIFYTLNITYNTLGSIAAGYGLTAFGRTGATGTAVLTALTADSIAVPSAPLSGFVASRVYKHCFNKIHHEVGTTPYDVTPRMETELTSFKMLLQSHPSDTIQGSFDKRLSIYNYWNDVFLDYDLKYHRHLRHLQEVAVASSLVGPLLGGTAVAQETLGTVAYFSTQARPLTARNLGKSAGILQTTINGSAITISTLNMVRALHYEWKVGKEHGLPSQIINKRLQTLAELERTNATPTSQ